MKTEQLDQTGLTISAGAGATPPNAEEVLGREPDDYLTPDGRASIEAYKAENARNNHSGRGYAFEPFFLNLNRDGGGSIGFSDTDAQWEQDEGKMAVFVNVKPSEIIALRDALNKAFPSAGDAECIEAAIAKTLADFEAKGRDVRADDATRRGWTFACMILRNLAAPPPSALQAQKARHDDQMRHELSKAVKRDEQIAALQAENERLAAMFDAVCHTSTDLHKRAEASEARVADMREALTQAQAANERDRTELIMAVNALKDEFARRSWLMGESRGSYEWDDDRYRQEFRDAMEAFAPAIDRLRKIGADRSNCPTTQEGVEAARADDAHRYATRLLISLMEKHYPDRSPEWKPLPDLCGVLTQIDNLSTGLVRDRKQSGKAVGAEPTPHDIEWLQTLVASMRVSEPKITRSDVNRLQLILDKVDTHSEYGNAKFASMVDFDDFKEIVQRLYAHTFYAKETSRG